MRARCRVPMMSRAAPPARQAAASGRAVAGAVPIAVMVVVTADLFALVAGQVKFHSSGGRKFASVQTAS